MNMTRTIKALLLIVLGVLSFSCMHHNDELYKDKNGVIVDMAYPSYHLGDNLASKKNCSIALVQDSDNPTMYMELSTCEKIVDDRWFLSHKIGDKVHFVRIRKDRYFPLPSYQSHGNLSLRTHVILPDGIDKISHDSTWPTVLRGASYGDTLYIWLQRY